MKRYVNLYRVGTYCRRITIETNLANHILLAPQTLGENFLPRQDGHLCPKSLQNQEMFY